MAKRDSEKLLVYKYKQDLEPNFDYRNEECGR